MSSYDLSPMPDPKENVKSTLIVALPVKSLPQILL